MGPRPSASENVARGGRGHPAANASMGPRPSASENLYRLVARRFVAVASMGPRPSASENANKDKRLTAQAVASMGPRPSASENNAAVGGLCLRAGASMGPRPSASENQAQRCVRFSFANGKLQWGRGHRPRKTRPTSGWNNSAPSCFNGAEAIGLGKLSKVFNTATRDSASMGPRPSASENRGTACRCCARSAGFKGAEAIGLGKRAHGHAVCRGHGASMGPRPSASENRVADPCGARTGHASMGPTYIPH